MKITGIPNLRQTDVKPTDYSVTQNGTGKQFYLPSSLQTDEYFYTDGKEVEYTCKNSSN